MADLFTMTTTESPPVGRRWLPMAVVAALLIGTHLLAASTFVSHLTSLAVGVGAAGLAWFGARRSAGRHRRFAVLLAAGITASAFGDIAVIAVSWPVRFAPNLPPGYLLWTVSYGCIAAALFAMLRAENDDNQFDFEGLIDAGVVFVATLLVIWELKVQPAMADASLAPVVRGLNLLHPVIDLVLLALVVRMLLRTTSQAGTLLAAGVLCRLGADFYRLLMPNDASRTLLELGWMVGLVLVAASAFASHEPLVRNRRPAFPPTGRIDVIGVRRIGVTLLPMLVPGVLELHGYLAGTDTNPVVMLAGSVALVMLAFLRAVRLVLLSRTVTEALMARKRYAAAVATTSTDAVVVIDDERRIIGNADRLAELVGHPGVDYRGHDLLSLVDAADWAEAAAVIERCLVEPGTVLDGEVRVRHADGRPMWLHARVVNLLGDRYVDGVVVTLYDITDRKQVEEELAHQAFHDSLTGLANRALFRDRLEHAMDRDPRTGTDPAVVFLDLDGFKTVNDSLGHDAGDQLLHEVATRLLSAVRRGDTVARLGGDEFAILIEQSARPLDEATAVADRVLQVLSEPVRLGQHNVTLTASLGIAVCAGYDSSGSLLRDADVAMYRAKTMGKGRWVVYEPGMRAAAVERLELENDLRTALAGDQFTLEYQPVIELETERVVGFEALLRWHHPTHGLIEPDRFIPIAEDTGLIVPIGRWVLDEATRTAADWQRRFGANRRISMAVNVSARQLATPDLVDDVALALAASGLEPSALVLEMTETVLVHDPEIAAERLHTLRKLGVRLAIDDFGTGYSSLSYLRQFPVDILKIDRSFINTISPREHVPAIVRGLIDLGRTLQLETVAEGVEHEFQRDSLRDEHCTLAQGFLFARPLRPVDAELLLADLAFNDIESPTRAADVA